MIPDEAGFGQQIPLPFTQFEPLDFDLYLTGENEEVQALLQQTAAGVQGRSVVLWGDHGSGKSHLLPAGRGDRYDGGLCPPETVCRTPGFRA